MESPGDNGKHPHIFKIQYEYYKHQQWRAFNVLEASLRRVGVKVDLIYGMEQVEQVEPRWQLL